MISAAPARIADAGGAVLVTGAGGFIGRHLVSHLRGNGMEVRGVCRSAGSAGPGDLVADIGRAGTVPAGQYDGVGTLVHLAALAHAAWPESEYLRVNVEATVRLAAEAAQRGVRRFIFLSSAGIHGTSSPVMAGLTHRFTESDAPAPWNAYTRSKLEAERRLAAVSAGTNMQCVILRLPLVYGAGARASFLRLLRAVERRVPLPLDGVRARRSLMYAGNLVRLIARIMRAPPASGTFLASDADLGIGELVRLLAEGMGVKARLWSCPRPLLAAATRVPLLGRSLDRLTQSFLVDNACLRSAFAWQPEISARDALLATAASHREAEGAR